MDANANKDAITETSGGIPVEDEHHTNKCWQEPYLDVLPSAL